jgi:alpha-L-rhamnosidase
MKKLTTCLLLLILSGFLGYGQDTGRDINFRNAQLVLHLKNQKHVVDSIMLRRLDPDWIDKIEIVKYQNASRVIHKASIHVYVKKQYDRELNKMLQNSSTEVPTNLRAFDRVNPLGTGDKPYFGWYVNDRDINEIQTAYQIMVASSRASLEKGEADIWNSGKVLSGSQNYVYYQGVQLKPSKRYYWRVRTWDKDGNASSFSDVAQFETGLFSSSDWSGASWIRRNTNSEDDYTYFRKKVQLQEKTIQSATLFVSACHSYNFYVNGKLAGKGYNHHYPQYSYYQAWDITRMLSSGSENAFSCLTHWYGGGQGRAAGERGLLVKAVIRYADSTETVIVSNNLWKQTQAKQWVTGQKQRNGEGIGRIEAIDSRLVSEDWNAISYDDYGWEPAQEKGIHPVSPWTNPLIPDLARLIEKEINPVSVQRLESGKYVIDLGKIYAGSFKINFKEGVSGDTIKMYGGFVLDSEGTISKKLNQQTNMDFSFIHNGKSAVFHPHVYLGMRYLQIENWPGQLNSDDVLFVSRHYEMDPLRSEFMSSVPMLNSVWNLMQHSLVVGSQEGFVDTPTREKGAFLGDSWSQSVPAMSVMYDRIMSLRSLNEFLTSQDHYWPDGRLNAVYPNADGARDIPDYTQSFLVWVWDYYLQTGNLEFLQTNYSRLKKIGDYIYRYQNDTTGLIHRLEGGSGPYKYGIIDWPAGMRYGYDMAVDSRTVINAYAFAGFDILARIAALTGNLSDAEAFNVKAAEMEKAINDRLINKDGVYSDGIFANGSMSNHVSQHANIMPVALGIVPEINKDRVLAEIKTQKMSVGMVCLRWLPDALGNSGEGAHLIDLYTNPEWDGWAKTIEQGGTVTWESWDAPQKNESMSHPWGAVGLLGIQKYMLGIETLKPQHEYIRVKPLDFQGKLQSVRGKYPTDRGDIVLNWDNSKRGFKLTITIPVNITARVYVPRLGKKHATLLFNSRKLNGIIEGNYVFLDNIGSGTHTFERLK